MATPKPTNSSNNNAFVSSQETSTFEPSEQIVDVSVETSNSKRRSSVSKAVKTTKISAAEITNKSVKRGSSSTKNSKNGNGGSSSNTKANSSGSDFTRIQGIALGMIETRGMVPAIEAADAMTKAAEVQLVSRDYVGGGYVTVMVRGETGAVNASVRAGADACERVGDGLVAAHIIARPHVEVEPVLQASNRSRGG